MVSSKNGKSNGNGQHGSPSSANNGKSGKTGPLSSFRTRPIAQTVRYAHIVGWGMKVPDTVVTNADLEAVVETTDAWIRTRTGIHERRIASERESVVSLGFEAARAALSRANVLPSEIDLIIVATSTPEDIYPSTACKIQNLLGSMKAGAFDLSAACSGFVYAMNMAAQSIRSGSIETALVIGSEVNSRVLDWSDRSTCILFGDGAGAVVLQGRDEPGGVLACELGADGSGADLLGIPTVGYASLPEGRLLHKLHMDGPEVFRFATHIMNMSIREVVEKANLTLKDIALVVPHQANQRILAAAARSLKVPEDLFYSNVRFYGNTSAASIPIALCEAERDQRIKPNDNIILIGFGGGLTWATMAIQWQVVPVEVPRGVAARLAEGRREAEYVLAFWRALVLRYYRRIEAMLGGTSPKTVKPSKTTNGHKPESQVKGDEWKTITPAEKTEPSKEKMQR
jgi:3-oxoacyl-[acyl-carrier-protein] synthase-3